MPVAGRSLILFTITMAGCARPLQSVSIFNPENLVARFGGWPDTEIGITDPGEGVFDTADWAFIRQRPPWEPVSIALSEWTRTLVHFRPLKPFQIHHKFKSRQCDFALVSREDADTLRDMGAAFEVVAVAEPHRRQGVLVTTPNTGVQAVEDFAGRRIAFGPRRDPVLFYKALELLDRHGISPSDLQQENVITGFDGSLQNHDRWETAAYELVYGFNAHGAVLESAVFDALPETGGRWLPLGASFSKDQFVEIARTDVEEPITLNEAQFIAAPHVTDQMVDKVRSFLVSAHVRAPQTLHALGFGRFSAPPVERPTANTSTEDPLPGDRRSPVIQGTSTP